MNTITFMSGLLTFYLKGRIKMTQDFLRLAIPNTVLYFIPLGSRKLNFPVTQIATVNTSFFLDIKSLLIGALLTWLGKDALFAGEFMVFLISFVLGVSMLISSFRTILLVEATSGSNLTISFLIFERQKAELAAEMINRSIATRHIDTNVRVQNEYLGDRIVGAIDNMNNRNNRGRY